jgi:hypothetical protein
VLHLQDRFFRIPDHPESDGVYVDRNGVGCEGRLGAEVGHADPLVHELGHLVDHGHDEEKARLPQSPELAEPEHHGPLPLVGNLDGRGHEERHGGGDQKDLAVRTQLDEDPQTRRGAEEDGRFPHLRQAEQYGEAHGRAQGQVDGLHTEIMDVEVDRQPQYVYDHQQQDVERSEPKVGPAAGGESLKGDSLSGPSAASAK